MTQPELRIRASGFGGSGYVWPATSPEDQTKIVKNADGVAVKAKLVDGKLITVPGVTTVLKAAASPAITQWSVDQTAAYAVANLDKLATVSPEQGWGFLRWYHTNSPLPISQGYNARNYYQGVLDDSAQLGTGMHEWIQADVVPGLAYPDIDDDNEPHWQMVEVWNTWLSANWVEPVMTEVTVWSKEFGYAGTFDALWKINGKLCLFDIKTSRGLWPDHSRQLAALKYADTLLLKDEKGDWTESPWSDRVGEVDSFGFLHVRPDDTDSKGNYVPRYIEYVEAEDLDLHFEAFKGYLSAIQADLAIKDRQKARGKSQQ